MPFVALHLYEDADEDKEEREKELILIFLSCSLTVWLILNILFFCTIDLSYANTFIGIKTGPQLTCERFKETEIDESKFRAAFENRSSYTKAIHGEVKTWVEENVDKWINNNEEWFQADKVPNELLPARVQLAEGGASRRRSSGVSFKEVTELVGGEK